MNKILLGLICLFAIIISAGAACATSDVDNMAAYDSTVNQDVFVSVDIGDQDFNLVYPVNQNSDDLNNDNAIPDGDRLVSEDISTDNPIYNESDSGSASNDTDDLNSSVDPTVDDIMKGAFISVPVEMDLDDGNIHADNDMYFQSVKWIIPAKELNASVNFWIPEPSVPDFCHDDIENTNICVEKDVNSVWNLDCIHLSADK